MAKVLLQSSNHDLTETVSAALVVDSLAEHTEPAGGPYGERLVVNTIDELARRTPSRVWATVSRSRRGLNEGFRDINIGQLADAVNHAAWHIHRRFGPSETFDVIAYLGVSDVRYAIYTFAAIKTGHTLMIPSVRNSSSQHVAVFEDAKCNKVMYSLELESSVRGLKSSIQDLDAEMVPDLDELIGSRSSHYNYGRTWAQGRRDPILIAHSSGSTGNPKPTVITNGVYSTYDNHRRIPPVAGRKIQGYTLFEFADNGRFFCPFPPFHLAGMFAMTIMPIFYSSTVTLGPSEKPPTGDLLSQAMRMAKFRGVWCPPSLIEQLAALPGGVDQISHLEWMIYTGGPLAPAVGDVVSRVTDLCQMYGSTETGPQIALIPLPENWNWFEWHPVLQNTMESIGDDTYEMVCYKEQKWDHLLHLQQAYPELQVWRTRDLFVRNPENPKLWRFVGRRDDVIVLSNGEKFNPVSMEGTIAGHPLVKGAIIIGTARIQACLIVEPVEGLGMADDELLDNIWPTIQVANTVGPSHGRIFRHKVIIAKHEKPFVRAGKGTIIRSQTANLYADEVEELYRQGSEDSPSTRTLDSLGSLEAISNYIRACVNDVLSHPGLLGSDDLFVSGMDSLQTIELSRLVQRGLQPHLKESTLEHPIQAPQIYENPTIDGLSKYVFNFMNNIGVDASDNSDRLTKVKNIESKYTSDLPWTKKRRICVAITGTTGSLGSYILERLITDPNVYRVYCLNRSSDSQTRQHQAYKDRGKEYDFAEKTIFLKVKFGESQFGLSEMQYEQLHNDVDAIIHNAWKVNFNHKLPSFENEHIRGVRDFVDFALCSNRQPHIFFVSSISSVGNWGQVHGYERPVPESPLEDYNVALHMGYAESKHISERIITTAVEKSNLKASILRVGQVAGPISEDSGGCWNLTEWMPALVKSSKSLGKLPDSMNTIDWIPVDTLAEVIQQLVHSDCDRDTSQVYNLINPHVAHWPDMVSAIQEYWKSDGLSVDAVPYSEWLASLKLEADEGADVEAFPALKLLDFFIGLAEEVEGCKAKRLTYETAQARKFSQTMGGLRGLDGDSMRIWMKQWSF